MKKPEKIIIKKEQLDFDLDRMTKEELMKIDFDYIETEWDYSCCSAYLIKETRTENINYEKELKKYNEYKEKRKQSEIKNKLKKEEQKRKIYEQLKKEFESFKT